MKNVFTLSAVTALSASLLFSACSSDSDSGLTAPQTAMGIWKGELVSNQPASPRTYEMTLVLFMPEGGEEGLAVGAVIDPATDEGVVLFDGGYSDGALNPAAQDACPDPAERDIIVGAGGFALREFDFVSGSAGSDLQRGNFCFTFNGGSLTGTVDFEEIGKFAASLVYSQDNTINSSFDTLAGKTWVDNEFGWSKDTTSSTLFIATPKGIIQGTSDNPGMQAMIDPSIQTFQAMSVDPASSCAGIGLIYDIAGQNIFVLGPFPEQQSLPTEITVTNCTPSADSNEVDGKYNGAGFITRGDAGQDQFVIVITSFGSEPDPVSPARALYNVFE